MITSESIDQIATAMAKAQAAMVPAEKANTNPVFRSKYADLSAFWEAARKPLSDNGLAVWQDVTTNEMGACVVTRVTHTSGQWMEFGPLCVPAGKRDAQGVGSAITYGRRYAFAATCGLVSDDDDGNDAVKSTNERNHEHRQEPRQETRASNVDSVSARKANGTAVDIGGEISETSVESVTKSGDGKRFGVKFVTGEKSWTDNEAMAQRAKQHAGTGEVVRVITKRNGDLLTLLSLTLVETDGGVTSKPPATIPPAINDDKVPF